MFVTKAPFESRVAKHVQSLIQPETDKEPVFHLKKMVLNSKQCHCNHRLFKKVICSCQVNDKAML